MKKKKKENVKIKNTEEKMLVDNIVSINLAK